MGSAQAEEAETGAGRCAIRGTVGGDLRKTGGVAHLGEPRCAYLWIQRERAESRVVKRSSTGKRCCCDCDILGSLATAFIPHKSFVTASQGNGHDYTDTHEDPTHTRNTRTNLGDAGNPRELQAEKILLEVLEHRHVVRFHRVLRLRLHLVRHLIQDTYPQHLSKKK